MTDLETKRGGFLIKHKLALLIVMPLLLILFFLAREVEDINKKIISLEKANATVVFLDMLFDNDINHEELENKKSEHESDHANGHHHNHEKTKKDWVEIKDKIQLMFRDKKENLLFNNLLTDFKNSIELLEKSKDLNEFFFLFESHIDAHGKLLMGVEKVHYNELIIEVDNHLRSLYQLEWMMFWAQEESIFTRLFIDGKYPSEMKFEMTNKILLLIQNQELFFDRFLAINADETQKELLFSTFNNKEFREVSDFRKNILNGSFNIETLSREKQNSAMTATAIRLDLLKKVANKIELNLVNEIESAILNFENQRTIFVIMSLFAVLVIMSLALHIGFRLTKNLNIVLSFLSKKPELEEDIDLNIKGRDELYHFAGEVKKLTIENINQNKKIIKSKEEAEVAKNRAIKANKAKSSFLANMSHEIRTPLNGVIGMLEVLNDTSLTTTQKDYLTTIETSSHLLLSLINDVLDFSKIESGMLQVNPHSTAIRETVYDVASIVQSKIKEKNIELKLEIDKKVPIRVLVDDHRLRQVLMNFVSNAVKFTSSGEVVIGITHIETQGRNSRLQFSVKDSGIGISKDRQENIFNAFAQEDSSTTKQYGGSGLGLAISVQLVELMGGKIKLESEKNIGSRFCFDLELKIEDQSEEKIIDKDSEVYLVGTDVDKLSYVNQELDLYQIEIKDHLESLSKIPETKALNKIIILIEDSNSCPDLLHNEIKRLDGWNICLIRSYDSKQHDFKDDINSIINYPILGNRFFDAIKKCSNKTQKNISDEIEGSLAHVLVAEDNLTNQKVISLHLKKANCSFEITNNGEEVFEALKENPDKYDFILMDYMMPVKNGLEATINIRNHEKLNNLVEIPIVALTASIVNEDIQMFYDNGMNDYLQKPFKSSELNEKIHKTLKYKKELVEKINNLDDAILDSRRVMLIEDNKINQKVASLLLSKAGYEHKIAEDGQFAVDYYKSDPSSFSLLLMDCMMPNKDGFQATKEIREYEKENNLPRIPILALTASIVDDDIKNCFDSGMDAFIPKPVKKERLLNEMSKFLSKKTI